MMGVQSGLAVLVSVASLLTNIVMIVHILSVFAEDSGLVVCDTVSLDEHFLTF